MVNFRRILYISKLDKRKLKLKNYELKKSSPDYGEVEFKTQPLSEYSEYIEENAEKNPELELDIIFEKKDILKMSFARIFSDPATIIIISIGLILFVFGILYFGSLLNPATVIVAFLAFPQFIFLPIAVSFGYNKLYKNDDNLKKSVKYIFYKDYYVIKNFAGERRIDCINIEKVVEKESCFVLHLTSKLLQIMPKKVFEEKERELKKFRQLMNEYQSCKSSVRV